jgi:hypothetical protein
MGHHGDRFAGVGCAAPLERGVEARSCLVARLLAEDELGATAHTVDNAKAKLLPREHRQVGPDMLVKIVARLARHAEVFAEQAAGLEGLGLAARHNVVNPERAEIPGEGADPASTGVRQVPFRGWALRINERQRVTN